MTNNLIESELCIEDIENLLLLEAIYLRYGYDFRDYSIPHVKRRIQQYKALVGISDMQVLLKMVIYDRLYFDKFLPLMSVTVTELFRDPVGYIFLRKEIIPLLQTYPYLKIWMAGCATGEEVYSMAIMLKEEGLENRVTIYATDFNEESLKFAARGVYESGNYENFQTNYRLAGGRGDISDYCSIDKNSIIMNESLKNKIAFSDHNLVTDGVFGEMNLICCMNVLIYFNKKLKKRVLELFYDSLQKGCFLWLGTKESLEFDGLEDRFVQLAQIGKIYKKI